MESSPSRYERVRRLRSDAEQNRDRIIVAARQVYGKEGLSASMNGIARTAGVGIATLFRRFPNRSDLIVAVFGDAMARNRDAAVAALDAPSAWEGFRGYIETACGLQAANRGFAEVLVMNFGAAKELERQRQEALEAFTELTGRAKAEGRLREDFTSQDFPILLMANAGVLRVVGDSAPEASKRLVAQLLRAYAVDGDVELPPPPTPKGLMRGMARQRWASR
jgi:AcrR family transcriptional regulator